MAKLTKAELAADKAMREIWAEWFSFYEKHFRGRGIAISAADQMAFYEIAQPKLFDLVKAQSVMATRREYDPNVEPHNDAEFGMKP